MSKSWFTGWNWQELEISFITVFPLLVRQDERNLFYHSQANNNLPYTVMLSSIFIKSWICIKYCNFVPQPLLGWPELISLLVLLQTHFLGFINTEKYLVHIPMYCNNENLTSYTKVCFSTAFKTACTTNFQFQ